ncbi:MAG: Sec-independent protein translocase subunit TatB [Geodermatophilaceae bacterium]|nr:Sec-independent protein translocase subunit TatB [Geodermatophilaceae bacterium]MDQ3456648.1 sec-independent translocase [Actinomycetota bacterium]
MFSSIGWGEIMVLLIVALFIFGPDRLPSIARDAAGAMQKVRGFVTGARAQIREELGDEFADIDLRSLNPREFVRRQLLDDDPPPLKRSNGQPRSSRPPVSTTRVATPAPVSTTKPASARMAEPQVRPTDPAADPPLRAPQPAVAATPPYDDAT